MKKLLITTLTLFTLMFSGQSLADATKGQTYYFKYLKPYFNMKGDEFAQQHLKVEWKSYFKKDGKKFIKKYSKKYPASVEFLKSEEFKKIVPHLKDFTIKYAADSGELPDCSS